MTGLVLCQKHISAVRWVMGKYWQLNFLKADFCPDALMETVVVLHYFWAYVSGQGASVALGWRRYGGVPGSVSVPHLRKSWLPLEAALRLDLKAGSYFCFSSPAPGLLSSHTSTVLVFLTLMNQVKWWKFWYDFFNYFLNFLLNVT